LNAFYSAFAPLAESPWLALIPAALFFVAAYIRGSRFIGAAGVVWLVYALYELGMRARVLCSGDCNIRLDLLVIYPTLVVLSLAAVIAIFVVRDAPHA
jgi:lysylphosphatidylglycerol synthetase-like protein (DUF2156 family)